MIAPRTRQFLNKALYWLLPFSILAVTSVSYAQTTPPEEDWVFCSRGEQVCIVPAPSLVRYGSGNNYFYLQVDDSIACNSAVFGNPSQWRKHCDYLLNPVSTPSPTPTPVATPDPTPTPDPTNPHTSGTAKHDEHAAVLSLFLLESVTHQATNNGSWFDTNTWAEGEVPGDNAQVLIKDGITVTYDNVSDARLFLVLVNGVLTFSPDVDSKMIFDTMFVDTTGTLLIGTEENPIQSGVNVDLIIADNGDIDTTWDTTLVSRSLIAHGPTRMHGQEKTTHLKVLIDPKIGDNSITLAFAPQNWQVGDTIVLAGTIYDGHRWDGVQTSPQPPQDEVLTITQVNGNVVTFSSALQYDHGTPRADLKTSVANHTRNISIESENGASTQIHHRGHMMFMHNDDVDVRYVEFKELGRTNKSISAKNPHEFDPIMPDSNVKGRYSMHFHRPGLEDIRNPAIAIGNAVFGSPGWGYVHHDGNAILHNNASYKTFGSGFVAETGNEIGSWSNNIAIYAEGMGWGTPKSCCNVPSELDNGRSGSGFYFEGRMVKARNNIAASVNSGFAYFHRGRAEDPENGLDGVIPIDSSFFDLPEAVGLSSSVTVDDVPILHFSDNETFASKLGVFVEKRNAHQGHDVRSVLKDFTAWNVINGGHISYTAHYLLLNFDVIGRPSAQYSNPYKGIDVGTNASDVTIVNAKINGFAYGFRITDVFNSPGLPADRYKRIFVVNPTMTSVDQEYMEVNDAYQVLSGDGIVDARFELNITSFLNYKEGLNSDPTARVLPMEGTKTDSLGVIEIPAGDDLNSAKSSEIVRILETDGYYTAADGKRYFILEDYYSDRVTGEIHKYGTVAEIDDSVQLGSPFFAYRDAVDKGVIDLNSVAPIAVDDAITTTLETEVVVDLLVNDSDADFDVIVVDGITQPTNGRVYDNKDGTVTYHPDFDFIGVDTFKYWVTDYFGNFTPATVTVTVQ